MYFVRAALLSLTVAITASAASAQVDPVVARLQVPEGFRIELFADGVDNARSLALGDSGTVFVSSWRGGRVYALAADDRGRLRRKVIADDLQLPNGIACRDGDLYVAELTRILRFPDVEARTGRKQVPQVVYDRLPGERHHGARFIDFGPDGRLYVSIGAPCNVCERDGFGLIGSLAADGSDWRVEARGIRNSVGFTWHPVTGNLWFTDNGRDMLGDNRPPGELNRVTARGQHFGFPYCHGGDIADPQYGGERDCRDFVAPAQKLGPHVAPLGVLFYTGKMFPESYRNQVFIAEHGSWNRSQKIGYRITLVRLNGSDAVSYAPFAEGWLHDGGQVSGRPVDLLQLPDGSLLVSDDQQGRIYRITYHEPLAGIERRQAR